jgi:predicted transcriptional regulator
MKIDNIDYFSSEKLQKVIEQRFGQSININDLSDSTLDLFQESVQDSVDKFEHSVGYTKLSTNPTYMENKILLDYITKEQEKRMKVSKVMGKEVELTDPNNPGVKTTIEFMTCNKA